MIRFLCVSFFFVFISAHAAEPDCNKPFTTPDSFTKDITALLKRRTPKAIRKAAARVKAAGVPGGVMGRYASRFDYALKKMRNYELTVEIFGPAHAAVATHTGATITLADALINLNRPDEALTVMQAFEDQKGLDGLLDPLRKRYYRWKALALFDMGRFSEAADAVKAFPGYLTSPGLMVIRREALKKVWNTGLAFAEMTDADKQLVHEIDRLTDNHDWKAAAALIDTVPHGDKLPLLRRRIELLNYFHRYDEAIAVADHLQTLEPNHPWPMRKKAYSLFMSHRFEEALANVQRVIALGYESPGTFMWEGKILLRLGRDREAFNTIEFAMQLSQAYGKRISTGYQYVYAQALTKVDRLDEAESILNGHPEMYRAEILRARIYIKRANYAAAVAALENSPPTAAVQWMRAQALYGLGNMPASQQTLLEMLGNPLADQMWVVVALLKIERQGAGPRDGRLMNVLKKIGPAEAARFADLADTLSWTRIGDADAELGDVQGDDDD